MNRRLREKCRYTITISLLIGTHLLGPSYSVASPDAETSIRGCNDQEIMLSSHPDVQTVQTLSIKLQASHLVQPEVGLSRQDFADVLLQLSRNTNYKFLSPSDKAVISQLQTQYALELDSLKRKERAARQKYEERLKTQSSLPKKNHDVLRGRIDGLESRTDSLEAQQFSTTTKLQGNHVFTAQFGDLGGETRPLPTPESVKVEGPRIFNTEEYERLTENSFQRPIQTPLSTFSIDVDTASYSNIRRFINQGKMPPKDAVRLEEMLNYFSYDYAQPRNNQPFSVTSEVATAPWNSKHQLVQIGLKGRELETLQPNNLVFLIDVSGSMRTPEKLPLMKTALCQLVRQLDSDDRVSIVVYAGKAGVALQPTPGNHKATIMNAIHRLEGEGFTAGGEGIISAYDLAKQNRLKNGNNRVILATDGDFNIGVSSNAELERLIEDKRKEGIFLTVLGVGRGNYKDSKMELLANHGNGNYAYLDTLLEAQKVLIHDLRSTLYTLAKDVKIQVEFNPNKVKAYRLIGYENRLLQASDFNDESKDAGEIGSGHTVTALYEIIPTGIKSNQPLPEVDPLKYQEAPQGSTVASDGNDLMEVKLRYKSPKGRKSKRIIQAIQDSQESISTASFDLKFASAIAMYGMILRDSTYKGESSYNRILELANQGKGKDKRGYRQAFINLVERSKALDKSVETEEQ